MTTLPPEIGYAHERVEPRACAITGQPVIGRHAVSFGLRDGYYYRILNKAVWQHNADFHAAMLAKLDAVLATDKPKTTKAADKPKEA